MISVHMALVQTEREVEKEPASSEYFSNEAVQSKDEGSVKKSIAHDNPKFADSSSNSEDGEVSEGDFEPSEEEQEQNASIRPLKSDGISEGPPLPSEDVPPLPVEPPPAAPEDDDGWAPIWEEAAQAFYFYNRFTGATQWTNPRIPEVIQPGPPGVEAPLPAETAPPSSPPASGYNPAIHGDYDPTAWYAQPAASEPVSGQATDPTAQYTATAAFNRFTGRYQVADLTPENFNDENKSKRQMNAFFDVDAEANSHDGRSLKAERSNKKISKTELKQFKEKRKQKKEEKRRAWLRD